MAIVVGAILILIPMCLGVVTAVSANGRARGAADLGAIAAAQAFATGRTAAAACAAAAQIVADNHAAPAGCVIEATGESTITTRVGADLPILGHRVTSARSRAGPILLSRAAN